MGRGYLPLKHSQNNNKNMDEEIFDFSQFNDEFLDRWEDYYNFDLPLSQNLLNILSSAVIMPQHKIQSKLVVSYMLIPSALAKICPICFCWGRAGTGKSTIGYLASRLYDVAIHTSGDTFAALRNDLNKRRWLERGGHYYEQNTVMVWDDIDPEILFNKPDIYRMLKFGYDKSSDRISIATSGGENLTFRTFSPKITGSVQPIFSDPRFPEIQRRCIVVKTQKLESLEDDSEGIELIDLKAINWEGFTEEYRKLWRNADTCQQYASVRRALSRKRPVGLSSTRWIISIDLLTTGIVSGVFEGVTEAKEFIVEYWQYFDMVTNSSIGAMMELLEKFIEEKTEAQFAIASVTGDDVIINPSELKFQIDEWKNKGKLEVNPNPRLVNDAMAQLGWKLSAKGWVLFEK